MGSYYGPFEASTSDMLHTQHPTDFEMEHFMSLNSSPLLGPSRQGLGGGMKELSDSLDADAGGRTVRAGRVSMFGDLVPICEGYPASTSETLASLLGSPGGEGFGGSLHEPNLLESFLAREHPPNSTLNDFHRGSGGGEPTRFAGQGFEGSAHGASGLDQAQGFEGSGQAVFEGSVHRGQGFEGSSHHGLSFEGRGQEFEGSAHQGQDFEGSAHQGQGFESSAHQGQGFEGSAHRGQGFEGSGHHVHFENSVHRGQGYDGSSHRGQGFEGSGHGGQGLDASTRGAQVFSTTGPGFSTSFVGSDSSLGASLHGTDHFRRTLTNSLAGSSGGGSSHGGGDYFLPGMGGGDGSFKGGGALQSVLVQGTTHRLPDGQRVCAWGGCSSPARGRTAFCIVHGGGKKCAKAECENAAEGRTKFCVVHGGGKRCQHEGCQKSAGGDFGWTVGSL
jgi:hypothetical protein